MQWESDLSSGRWIQDGLISDDSMHALIPRGFRAYARVFHPAFRERPIDASWPPEGDPDAWARFSAQEIEAEWVSWAETARALGTTRTVASEWEDIVGSTAPADDWRYDEPTRGELDPVSLASLASLLSGHTSTPNDGHCAVWDGWGGMVGFVGSRGSMAGLRAAFSDSAPASTSRHRALIRESFRDTAFRSKGWNPGLLDDQISRGPRLRLAEHDYVLFREAPTLWADPSWPGNVPWSEGDEAHAPSVIWPADRAWLIVTAPHAHSSVVAGSAEAISALLADPSCEAVTVDPAAAGWAL